MNSNWVMVLTRHEKMSGRGATGRRNFDRLRNFFACSFEFFSYTLLMELLSILYPFFIKPAHTKSLRSIYERGDTTINNKRIARLRCDSSSPVLWTAFYSMHMFFSFYSMHCIICIILIILCIPFYASSHSHLIIFI